MRAFLLVALVLLTACARRYTWSSNAGRQCFYECQRGGYVCRQSCENNGWCLHACRRDANNCMDTCPDVTRTK